MKNYILYSEALLYICSLNKMHVGVNLNRNQIHQKWPLNIEKLTLSLLCMRPSSGIRPVACSALSRPDLTSCTTHVIQTFQVSTFSWDPEALQRRSLHTTPWSQIQNIGEFKSWKPSCFHETPPNIRWFKSMGTSSPSCFGSRDPKLFVIATHRLMHTWHAT